MVTQNLSVELCSITVCSASKWGAAAWRDGAKYMRKGAKYIETNYGDLLGQVLAETKSVLQLVW